MTVRIAPTFREFESARVIVDEALELALDEFTLERDVAVEIGWGGEEWIVELVDGVSGFASYPNRIEIEFNTAANGWEDSLRSTTVHEFAHVWTYEARGRESETKWEYILGEAFTQHVAERLVPEYESPWWTRHDSETVADYWPDVVNELDDPSEDGEVLFIDATDGGYPLGLGYSLAYQVGDELLDTHDLTEIPNVGKQKFLEVGRRLYETE